MHPRAPPSTAEAVCGGARAASQFFKGINVDLLRATQGHVDLGSLAAMSFAVAGVVDVAVKGRLSSPPWFNLGSWAFRTFATMEGVAIQSTASPVRHDGSAPEASPARTPPRSPNTKHEREPGAPQPALH
ncbi:hypothetical protein D7V88_37165, partial [Corallococcus terminator]